MHDKAKEFFAAFKAGKMSRRELMSGAAKLGVSAATANFLFNAAATQALAADFDWKKFKGTKLHLLLNKHPYADAMIADLDNFKTSDRHGRHLRHLPGGRLFRQGDGRALVEVEPVRRLHDRRLHDLDLRAGGLDRRPQRRGSRIRPRPIRTTIGKTCCLACAPPPRGTACPAARSDRPTPSNGAYRGASSSTRSPTTARCTTRPA